MRLVMILLVVLFVVGCAQNKDAPKQSEKTVVTDSTEVDRAVIDSTVK